MARTPADMSRAQSEVDGLQAQLVAEYPDNNEGYRAEVVPLLKDRTAGVRAPLFVLLGAVGLVLLIACANIANLLAGTLDVLPMSGGFNGSVFTIFGRPEPSPADRPNAELRATSSGLFAGLGLPLVSGRLLEPADDRAGAARVVVIDQTAARRFWPREDPLGGRITYNDEQFEVVGFVGGLAHFALDRAREPTVYFPSAQAPSWMRDDPALIVRTSVDR